MEANSKTQNKHSLLRPKTKKHMNKSDSIFLVGSNVLRTTRRAIALQLARPSVLKGELANRGRRFSNRSKKDIPRKQNRSAQIKPDRKSEKDKGSANDTAIQTFEFSM